MVKITISNKITYTLISLTLLFILITGTYAYGTSNPAIFGHSTGELEGESTPAGAVMSFDLATCPDGWSEYANAKDRVIVGSGSSYARGSTGGESTHTLTVAEMPSHNHAITPSATTWTNGAGSENFDYVGGGKLRVSATQNTGEGNPHNNMQPYIALLYCIKD
jgi:hypothetical protein